MQRVCTSAGVTVSYNRYGSGPPLVLVHGSFSDHNTNWDFVKTLLARQFTVYAVARRGRGESDRTEGHSLEDEGRDIAAVIRSIEQPVYLLGHSYGAQVALLAAGEAQDRVRKLVLYEAAWPNFIDAVALARLEEFARAGDWDGFAMRFFHEGLQVPLDYLEELRPTDLWPPIVADGEASLRDLRALSRYDFSAARFSELRMPVLLQIGSESPRHLYVTDTLAAVLPDATIQELKGQAHEAMTSAPKMYADAVMQFLLGGR
jgi:pimeloyl-ACP methyl ester carboxylesterase